MLIALKEMMVRRNVEKALMSYGVQIIHFIPGRLRVKLHDWQHREQLLVNLIDDLRMDKSVASVHFTRETGTALIHYDHSTMNDDTLKRWMRLFQKYA